MSRRHRTGFALAALAAFAALAGSRSVLAEEPEPVRLPWQQGPATAPIGPDLAEIEIGESYLFLDADGTRSFMELNHNPVSGTELATIAPISDAENWFLVFEWDDLGYVKDDEKDELDAEAMLTSIREGNEAGNEERRERGWPTLEIVGWHEAPHYDARTHNLSWAIIGESENGRSINRIVKLLGRRGVMTVTLVSPPEALAAAVPVADTLLDSYRFKPGNTYAEFVPSTDKLAQYGLTALVVGGAGAALVKSGLLAKFWKPIAVALVALGAGVKRIFFGGRKAEQSLEGPIG